MADYWDREDEREEDDRDSSDFEPLSDDDMENDEDDDDDEEDWQMNPEYGQTWGLPRDQRPPILATPVFDRDQPSRPYRRTPCQSPCKVDLDSENNGHCICGGLICPRCGACYPTCLFNRARLTR